MPAAASRSKNALGVPKVPALSRITSSKPTSMQCCSGVSPRIKASSMFVEGFFARTMYASLHLMHHYAVLGGMKTYL